MGFGTFKTGLFFYPCCDCVRFEAGGETFYVDLEELRMAVKPEVVQGLKEGKKFSELRELYG
jgi:hypothetical protein